MNLLAETWTHGYNLTTGFSEKGWGIGTLSYGTGFHGGSTFDRSIVNSFGPTFAWYNYDINHMSINASTATVTWGFRNICQPGSISGSDFMFINDNVSVPIIHLIVVADGTITAYRGSGTGNSLGSSSAGAFPSGSAPKMIECQVYRHASAGTVELRIDQVTVYSVTGVNTAGGSSNAAQFGFYCLETGQDHYVNDSNGSVNNSFAGDIRNELLMPNANGNYTDFTCSTGSDHSANVDEQHYNGLTDYNYSSTLNAKDSYQMTNLDTVTASAILAVHIRGIASKSETPPRGIKAFCRSNSVDSALGTERLLPAPIGTWAGFNQVYETDPSGGAAWTIARVNAIEAGIDIST